MSTATPVPETWELTGDDARELLRSSGRRSILRDAFVRLRVADGFSHARSLAYATSLVFVQAIIALVGLAVAVGNGSFSRVVVRTLQAAVPGPGGDLLTDAVSQAHRAGIAHRYAGLVFGLVGALITGSTLLGQLERGLNRIYGVEQDRPTVRKYGLALALTVTAGTPRRARVRAARVRRRRSATSLHNGAAEPRLGRRPLAGRGRARDARDHGAVPLVASAPPAVVLVAGVRRRGRDRRLADRHRRYSGSSSRSAGRSARPTGRWRASSRSCCGRCSPRSRSSTAARSPPSSRRSGRACARRRIPRRSSTPSRTADRLPS